MLALRLYKLWWKSLFRRFFANFWQNIAVLICALIICGLCVYVFHDFIAERLDAVSLAVQHRAARWFVYALASLNAIIVFYCVSLENRHKRESYSHLSGLPIAIFAQRSGHPSWIIWLYKCLRAITIALLTGYIIYTLATELFAWAIDTHIIIFHLCATSIGASVGLFTKKSGFFKTRTSFFETWLVKQTTKQLGGENKQLAAQHLRILWKLRQFWVNYPPSRKLLMASCTLISLLTLTDTNNWLESLGICLFAGNLASVALCLEEATAMRSSAYEKLCGTSHKEYMLSLWTVASITAAILFILTLTSLSLRDTLVYHYTSRSTVDIHHSMNILETMKWAWLTALPILLAPAIIFQIEIRRAGVNAVIIALIGLFLGTAIMAHLASVLLLPIFAYIAYDYSNGAYYRQ
ncbi:MAG: hypothetical protein OXC44_01750 [Proteobacteria bacterium]|nr:hypothetical protein [Pseudomonadota bacterium]